MKETKKNIEEIEKKLRDEDISDKKWRSHRQLFRILNQLIILKNTPSFEEIAICGSPEELSAYCDTYSLGDVSSEEYEEYLKNAINAEKENLKNLYFLRNRPDSGMLASQNLAAESEKKEF